MKENKKTYYAPVLTVVAFAAEKGYTVSNLTSDPANNGIESMSEASGYGRDNNSFFD